MGYHTVLLVRNDGMHAIQEHAEEFATAIEEKQYGGTIGVGSHGNVAEVMRTHHNSTFHLYADTGGTLVEMSDVMETVDVANRSEFTREWIVKSIALAKQELARLEKALGV